jgi:hypothetical protein
MSWLLEPQLYQCSPGTAVLDNDGVVWQKRAHETWYPTERSLSPLGPFQLAEREPRLLML